MSKPNQSKKSKVEKITSPKGIASYPWLTKPDTKFDKGGVYKINLIVPAADAADLMADLERRLEVFKAEETKNDPKKFKAYKNVRLPFDQELDDDGNETGNVVFKFKQNATFKSKTEKNSDGTPKVEHVAPIPTFDAKGKKVNVKLGGGSTVKVSFSPIGYSNATNKEFGLTLRLKAVQVLDLKEYEGGAKAENYGFGEEDGFEAEVEAEASVETEGADAEVSTEAAADGDW